MLPITATNKIESAKCPIRSVLTQVTGKWQILILFALEDGALRFGEIRRCIGDISQRVLTENLRGLERDGYLTRAVVSEKPLGVSYELTELGQRIMEQLRPIIFWANEIMPTIKENRVLFEEKHGKEADNEQA